MKPFEILFNKGETTCFTANPWGTTLFDAHGHIGNSVYFSINPLQIDRRDNNVLTYRSILCEFDHGTTEEQLALITKSRLPFTLITFSGSKSLHAIISLEEPLRNRHQYDYVVQKVYAKFKPGQIDTTCKNPSRLSRIPGAIRPETGKLQSEIYFVPRRCTQSELANALKLFTLEPPELPAQLAATKPIVSGLLNPITHWFLLHGAAPGRWNRCLFISTIDLVRAGFSDEEIYCKLKAITGILDNKDLRTIKSALKAAYEKR